MVDEEYSIGTGIICYLCIAKGLCFCFDMNYGENHMMIPENFPEL